jgi:hypothetical protein
MQETQSRQARTAADAKILILMAFPSFVYPRSICRFYVDIPKLFFALNFRDLTPTAASFQISMPVLPLLPS